MAFKLRFISIFSSSSRERQINKSISMHPNYSRERRTLRHLHELFTQNLARVKRLTGSFQLGKCFSPAKKTSFLSLFAFFMPVMSVYVGLYYIRRRASRLIHVPQQFFFSFPAGFRVYASKCGWWEKPISTSIILRVPLQTIGGRFTMKIFNFNIYFRMQQAFVLCTISTCNAQLSPPAEDFHIIRNLSFFKANL